jgi:YggT family protein
MRIAFFVLDTVFFILVAAALLRVWMNQLQIKLTQQPGVFAMAVTDWLVKPVRGILPRRVLQSQADWGSWMAALLLCLAYGGVWLMLSLSAGATVSSPITIWLAIVATALQFLLKTALQALMFALLAYAVLSWTRSDSPVLGTLDRLCGPFLRPIRRWVPLIGGIDLSVLVLVVLLQIGLMLIG